MALSPPGKQRGDVVTAEVQDNPERNRFELAVDGALAVMEYRRSGKVLAIVHTEVPSALAGRGIGTRLASGALDIVRARGEKIIVRCSFITEFIARHAEYGDLIA
ncbi:MAG: N-acetyltransferase [Alphaproteobacteria bacterium]|nr:N-acetyltransferase [Alphaproteobacteria bacterium]